MYNVSVLREELAHAGQQIKRTNSIHSNGAGQQIHRTNSIHSNGRTIGKRPYQNYAHYEDSELQRSIRYQKNRTLNIPVKIDEGETVSVTTGSY